MWNSFLQTINTSVDDYPDPARLSACRNHWWQRSGQELKGPPQGQPDDLKLHRRLNPRLTASVLDEPTRTGPGSKPRTLP